LLLRHTLAWLLSASLLVSTTGRPLYRHFCSLLAQPATALTLAGAACPHGHAPTGEADCCLPPAPRACPEAANEAPSDPDHDGCKTEKAWQHTEPGPLQPKLLLPSLPYVVLPPVALALPVWPLASVVGRDVTARLAFTDTSPPQPGRLVLLRKHCWRV
jgi:hypothetical protein